MINYIKRFWKANKRDFFLTSPIYFFIGILIGAKKGIIAEEFFWLVLIGGLALCFLVGLLLSLLLGVHKE